MVETLASADPVGWYIARVTIAAAVAVTDAVAVAGAVAVVAGMGQLATAVDKVGFETTAGYTASGGTASDKRKLVSVDNPV